MLSIRDLDLYYGDAQALAAVSLEVPAGELVALVGANGAGKSSLIRSIAGMERPRAGKISFREQDVTARDTHFTANLGIGQVAEGRQVFPSLSVEENLEVGALLPRARAKRAQTMKEVFALFPRLAERRKQLAGTLSGGERQMLALGRALMSRPKLLMLDEPSLGLSPKLTEQTLAAVREIAKSLTVMIVEQKVMEGLEISDRGYVIEHGKLVKEGGAAQLIADPSIREAYLGL
jgi:branched-chain amino acid transport system ATP-binding protein